MLICCISPHNLHLLFCFILSIFALIWLVLMALFCATIWRDSVSLSLFPFLNHVQVFSMLLISRLKPLKICFFPFLFSSYCYSVGLGVVSIVSGGCNQSFSVLLYRLRVVVWMHPRCLQCRQILFLLLFLIHIVCQHHLLDVMLDAWSLVFLFFGPFAYVLIWSTSRMVRISYEGTTQVFILW